MRKSDEDRALELLGFLDGEALEFYYDAFALDGELTTEVYSYYTVRTAFLEHFAGP